MESVIKIGIIGDYDGRPSHLATQEAIRHCAAEAGILCECLLKSKGPVPFLLRPKSKSLHPRSTA
jgi:hypothetical protein